MAKELIPQEIIEQKIFIIRGHKVMFDKDLSILYGIETRYLNRAVTRNLGRFPEDFMFQLTKKEFGSLMFHFGTSSWGGTRKMPRVFTEHGILMLSSVLNSKRAIQVNIQIMRAFVNLRRAALTYEGLRRKIDEMEKKYDKHFKIVFDALKKLLIPAPGKTKEVRGFRPDWLD